MKIKYASTRDKALIHDFDSVLMAGLAPDGGLFMPLSIPKFSHNEWRLMRGNNYAQIAFRLLRQFTEGSEIFDDALLERLIHDAYENFNHAAIAPLSQIDHNLWLLELYHGPTLAFKDFALQLTGRMMEQALLKSDKQMTIIGATSGDTGSAAIAGYRGRKNMKIFILHPKDKVSEIQRKQMTCCPDENVFNIAIEGNFDDCQAMVKHMFEDHHLRHHLNLGAVNSINWMRVAAQTVYFAVAALRLGGPDVCVNFAVPTGNFGNILAAWLAKQMGLNINQLVIGSNQNDVLTRLISHNAMEKQPVIPSLAPSMDIQVSSNFERYLFDLLGQNSDQCEALMHEFKTTGNMKLTHDLWQRLRRDFQAHSLDDDAIKAVMRRIYNQSGIVIDPHTACGVAAAEQCSDDYENPMVVAATAHPAKFPAAVKAAFQDQPLDLDPPQSIKQLYNHPERFKVIPNDYDAVKSYIESNA
ncbi:MAG: threonine synthase [Alphaproteobacteria bacterium]